MARYAKDDPKSGGYFKLWAKSFLSNKKIGKLSLEEQGALIRVWLTAQILSWQDGCFKIGDTNLLKDQICVSANIKPRHLERFIKDGFIDSPNGTKSFKIHDWEEWQLGIKSELNKDKMDF